MRPLAELLTAIRSELGGIRDQLSAISNHQDAQLRKVQVEQRVIADIKSGEPIRIQEHPHDKHKGERWWALFIVESITAIAAIVLGFLTFYQYKQMRTATDAATEANKNSVNHFKMDQRPYLWIGDSDPTVALVGMTAREGRNVLHLQLFYVNFGKSPAYDVRVSSLLLVGPDSDRKSRVLPQAAPEAPVPPGKRVQLTVVTTPDTDTSKLIAHRSIDRGMVAIGKIEYKDGFGTRYETVFCYQHMAMGSLESCKDGNYLN